jgi:hypothetical protein
MKAPSKLSVEASKAVTSRSLTGSWDFQTLVALLHEIKRWDTKVGVGKARAKRLLNAGILTTVLGIFAFIVWSMVEDSPGPLLYAVPVLGCTIGMGYLGYRKGKQWRSVDIPDEVRLTLLPVLQSLRQDLHPGRKIRVQLALRVFDEDQHKTKRSLPPGRNKSLTEHTYDEPVGMVRLPLANGAFVVIRMSNHYIRITRSYSNARGKSKTKNKWKKQTWVTCIMIPESPSIEWNSQRVRKFVDPKHEHFAVSQRRGVTAASISRKYVFKKAEDHPEDTFPPEQVMKMLVCLNTIRAVQPAKGTGR